MRTQRVVIAGAGTAGHIEPALVIGDWLREHYPEVQVTFIGTKEGIENRLVPQAGFELALIKKAAFPRHFNKELFTWKFRFAQSLMQAARIVKGSDLVVGFGGYVSASAYLAAKISKVPMVGHEANAKMGMANKLAGFFGGTLLTTFVNGSYDVVGIPLRPSIVSLAKQSIQQRKESRTIARKEFGLDPDKRTILVFGGSMGSVKFNSVISEALRSILPQGIQVIHAVGQTNDLPDAQKGYAPFSYIDDMASAYAAADFVISRSGAVTTIETGVLGIYSLYVPLAIGNGEQLFNAQSVSSQGGGEIIENSAFTAENLVSRLDSLMKRAISRQESGESVEFPMDATSRIGLVIAKFLRRAGQN